MNRSFTEEVVMQNALKIVGRIKDEPRIISKSSDANTVISSLNALNALVNQLEEECAGHRGPILKEEQRHG